MKQILSPKTCQQINDRESVLSKQSIVITAVAEAINWAEETRKRGLHKVYEVPIVGSRSLCSWAS